MTYTPQTTLFIAAIAPAVVTRDQMRHALGALGVVEAIDEATPAANTDTTGEAMRGPLYTSTGPAAAFIRSQLGYTAAQMNALFVTAATYSY